MDKGCTFPDLSVTDACKNGFGKFATFLIENNLFNDRSLEMNFLTEKFDDAKLIELTRMARAKNIPVKASLTNAYKKGKFEFADFLIETNIVDKTVDMDSCIFDLPDANLIALMKDRRISVKDVSLIRACELGKFEFAKHLVENGLMDVNENLNGVDGTTPLYKVIDEIHKHQNLDNLSFIKFLVEHGAEVSGIHCYGRPLIFSFLVVVQNFWYKADQHSRMVPAMRKQLNQIMDYLVELGMNVNGLMDFNDDFITFRNWLEYHCGGSHGSSYYSTVLDNLIKHGGKCYV